MSGIPDIGPITGLQPKKKFIEEVGEDCINMDGVIALARQIDTPEAKAIYRAFRRRHASMRLMMPGKDPVKLREEAILQALADCGHKVNFHRAKGSMP